MISHYSWVSVNLCLDWCLLSGERITIANVNHICRQDYEIQSHTWYPEHCCPQWRDTRVSTVESPLTYPPPPSANGHLAAVPASLPLTFCKHWQMETSPVSYERRFQAGSARYENVVGFILYLHTREILTRKWYRLVLDQLLSPFLAIITWNVLNDLF